MADQGGINPLNGLREVVGKIWTENRSHAVTFCLLTLGYATYSASRRSLTVAMPYLLKGQSISGFSMTELELGALSSAFSAAYGVSKFFGGVLSDFVSCGTLFAGGLVFAALANMLFAFPANSFAFALFCWGLNGAVQGVGWPALSKILLATWSKENRGLVWSLCTAAGNAGTTLGPLVLAQVVTMTGQWESAFQFIGAAAGALGVFCMHTLKESVVLTHQVSELAANEREAMKGKRRGGTPGKGDAFATIVVFRWTFWFICIADAFVYFVLKGVSDWAMLLLVQRAGMDLSAAAAAAVWFDFGGILGTLGAGPLSDRLGNRNLASAIFSVVLAICLAALWNVTITANGAGGDV